MFVHWLGRNRGSIEQTSICIGNFDGVHLGHQALIVDALRSVDSLTPTLVTFYPHPREFFATRGRWTTHRSDQITPLRAKLFQAQRLGMRSTAIIHFSRALASLDPGRFFDEILVNDICAGSISVGYDWRFGRDRSGDVDLLRNLASRRGIIVRVIEPVCTSSGERISSTLVRSAMRERNATRFRELTGRDFSIHARLSEGEIIVVSATVSAWRVPVQGQALPGPGIYFGRLSWDNVTRSCTTSVWQADTTHAPEVVCYFAPGDHGVVGRLNCSLELSELADSGFDMGLGALSVSQVEDLLARAGERVGHKDSL